jgi:hypothetical protein
MIALEVITFSELRGVLSYLHLAAVAIESHGLMKLPANW